MYKSSVIVLFSWSRSNGLPGLREAIRRAGGLRCALESAPGIEFVKGGTVR